MTTTAIINDDDDTEIYWTGSCDPCDPDNYWIDDYTGERVNAITNERTQHVCLGSWDDDEVITLTPEEQDDLRSRFAARFRNREGR